MYNSFYFQIKYKKVISIYLNKHFFDINQSQCICSDFIKLDLLLKRKEIH